MSSSPWRSTAAGVLIGGTAAVCLTTTAVLGARIASALRQDPSAPWILGRASGLTSYLLMTALVLLGLSMSHPDATAMQHPSPRTRMRLHSSLAVFTLAFTALHIVVLATDPYAGVGWRGVLMPMASHYRPVAVTLGVVAVWSMLITGVSAALAGRLLARIWWPIHKVAVVAFVLVWAHGFMAGSDTRVLTTFYLATGVTVQLVALSRYTTRSSASRLAAVAHERRATTTRAVEEVRR